MQIAWHCEPYIYKRLSRKCIIFVGGRGQGNSWQVIGIGRAPLSGRLRVWQKPEVQVQVRKEVVFGTKTEHICGQITAPDPGGPGGPALPAPKMFFFSHAVFRQF